MDKIELRKIGSLRLHPDNVKIFGLPTDEPNYEEIRADIQRRGLQEPLIILANGTILSGHVRYSGVWWTHEQNGLTVEQIREQLIPVRVHEDFASKEEEIDYLWSANDKRRQMDPRRIATSLENAKQIDSGEKGKKGETFKRWAERFGVTSKLATTYCTIFGSKIVPEEYKDQVNSKALAPTTVLEAIKFAEESAQRERRAPSTEDVVIYLKNPKAAKSTLASTLREAAKTTATTAPKSTPAPQPAPVVVQAPPPAPQPAPVAVEAPKDPEPTPVVVKATKESKPAIDPSWGVHIGHCCSKHGCKYSEDDCPVADGRVKQDGPCEECGLISEGYYDPEMPEEEMIPCAHRLLLKSLGVATLNDELKSDLIGIHTELGSYLEAMGIITRSSPMAIPDSAPDRVALCISLVESITGVEHAEATRDALLELVSLAKASIERLTTTRRKLEPNGLFCPECLEPQLDSPSGATCSKGHGGLAGITEQQAGQIKLSQELSEEKFKCCVCGSQVEVADNYATHASCPKCGLVDTSDIESLTNPTEPNKDDDLDLDLLDEVINSEPPQVSEPVAPKSEDISADELAALLGQEEEAPKKAPEPKVQEKKIEPKKTPTKSNGSNGSEDPESALVTAVIDDFEIELQKAGVDITA